MRFKGGGVETLHYSRYRYVPACQDLLSHETDLPATHLRPQMEMQSVPKADQGYVQNPQNAANGEHWLCSTAPLNNQSKHNK